MRFVPPHTARRPWTPAALLAAALAMPAFGQFTFDPAVNLAAGERPDGAAAADLNGDGIIDLAVSSDNPDKVSILLGNGSGGFAAGPVIFTGSGTGAGSVAAGTFDGDADVDLIVVLKNTNAVRVYLNDGLGTFTAGQTVTVGAEPVQIAVARLDANASLDLATANRSDNSATVLLNDGSAVFTAAGVAVGNDPRSIAAGDWNGDGANDLVVSNHDDRTLSLLSNSGGVFSPSGTLSVGGNVRPEGVTAADLNGDGRPDIASAVSGNGLNQAAVFLNTGAGFSGPATYATVGVNPDSIYAIDLDCDGDRDLVTSNQDSNNVSLLPNGGTGVFGAAMLLAVGTRPGTIAHGDFDGDAGRDLAVVNRDSNNVSILMNRTCSSVGDMNCDGSLNGQDIEPFVQALRDPAEYQQNFPDCDILHADTNGDGSVNGQDIQGFRDLLAG